MCVERSREAEHGKNKPVERLSVCGFEVDICLERYVCMYVCMHAVVCSPRGLPLRFHMYVQSSGGSLRPAHDRLVLSTHRLSGPIWMTTLSRHARKHKYDHAKESVKILTLPCMLPITVMESSKLRIQQVYLGKLELRVLAFCSGVIGIACTRDRKSKPCNF